MSRLPETGPSLRRIIEQERRRVGRTENSSAFTRSGTSVTAEDQVTVYGQMQSEDYDGTSRTDLGTTGWMLGPGDGGPSLLALNGVNVKADLDAKDVAILGLISDLGAAQSDLDAAQATLAAQVAAISALVNAQLSPAVGNATTGVTPVATSTSPSNHAPVTFTVPTGFTKAAVIGVSHIDSIVRAHTCATFIHGVVGDYLEVWPDEAGGSTFTRILTGLSAGGTFSVGTQVMANAAGGYVHAMTSAQVTFYR